METKQPNFTPGPWWPRYGGEPGFVYASDAKRLIAEIPHEKSDAIQRPDSRLIAAAPDLYAALRKMADAFDWTTSDDDTALHEQVCAALDKADGVP